MSIPVRIEPTSALLGQVEYRWDPDTDILTANVRDRPPSGGGSASVEIEGRDGSWVVLDLAGGQISGVEVAVWPDVRKRATLNPPSSVVDVMVVIPTSSENAVTAIEMNTAVAAEADFAERTFHFTLGPNRETRTVRIAREILIDLDLRDRIAGVWLLDVPPFPVEQ